MLTVWNLPSIYTTEIGNHYKPRTPRLAPESQLNIYQYTATHKTAAKVKWGINAKGLDIA